jgi:hypothetical protein
MSPLSPYSNKRKSPLREEVQRALYIGELGGVSSLYAGIASGRKDGRRSKPTTGSKEWATKEIA